MTWASIIRRVVPEPALPPDPWEATAGEIRRIASPCPVCAKTDLVGHSFGLFASEIAAEVTAELNRFAESFYAARWQELRKSQNFNGGANVAEAYFLSCAVGASMLYVRNPADPYDWYELLAAKRLSADEAAEIEAMKIELHKL